MPYCCNFCFLYLLFVIFLIVGVFGMCVSPLCMPQMDTNYYRIKDRKFPTKRS